MKVKYYPFIKTMNLIRLIDRHRDPIEMDSPQSIQWCGIDGYKTYQNHGYRYGGQNLVEMIWLPNTVISGHDLIIKNIYFKEITLECPTLQIESVQMKLHELANFLKENTVTVTGGKFLCDWKLYKSGKSVFIKPVY